MARKSFRHSKKNRKTKRKGQYGGSNGGATGYVGGLYGNLEQQLSNMNSSTGTGNIIQQNSHTSLTPAQVGGGKKSKSKSKRFIPHVPSAASLAGGKSKKHKKRKYRGGYPLSPSDIEVQVPAQEQTGGYFGNLVERAIVPFGLMGMQRLLGKKIKSRKNRK
jgi:hypothetical protein